MKFLFFIIFLFNILYANKYYYEFGEKIEVLKKQDKRNFQNSNIEYHKTKDGREISFKKNQIIVKCYKNKNCEDDFISLNLQNFKEISKTYYLIKLKNSENIFDTCLKLYKRKDIKIAHPNYITSAIKR